ncbi:MAG: MerR family transcriptional regulator [Thermoanaerobaculia bacterium]
MSAAIGRDSEDGGLFSITELADELGVTPRAIRFYEAKGLLEPQRAGATRVYSHRDRARLQIILRGKRLGFSLALVQKYLDLYDADPTHKVQLEHLLAGARQRIAELEAQRQDLELTIEELREIEDLTLEALGERLSPARQSPAFKAAESSRSSPAAQLSQPPKPSQLSQRSKPSKPSQPAKPARKGKKP